MPETVTDVIINASADRVWHVLTDFAAYPEWNPLIRRVTGELAANARLQVTRAASDGSDYTAHPTIVRLRPGREIRWRDRLTLPGILDTVTTLKIEPLGPQETRFVHWQGTSGLLAPLLGGGRDARLRDRLQAMNEALKGQVERQAALASSRDADAADVPAAAVAARHG